LDKTRKIVLADDQENSLVKDDYLRAVRGALLKLRNLEEIYGQSQEDCSYDDFDSHMQMIVIEEVSLQFSLTDPLGQNSINTIRYKDWSKVITTKRVKKYFDDFYQKH